MHKTSLKRKRVPPINFVFAAFVILCLCIVGGITMLIMTLQRQMQGQVQNKIAIYEKQENEAKLALQSMESLIKSTTWKQILNTVEIRDVSKYKRIIAIGDLHGDLKQTIKILRLTNIINTDNDWIANKTILIQTGDIIDRGPKSIAVYRLFLKLRAECIKYESLILNQIGNHEQMMFINDFTYVNKAEMNQFGGYFEWQNLMSIRSNFGKFLRNLPIARIIGNTLFVHAGILPFIAKQFDNNITKLNDEFHNSVMDISINSGITPNIFYQTLTPFEQSLFGINSPLWTRFFEPAYYDMSMLQIVFGHYAQNYNDDNFTIKPTQQMKKKIFLCDKVNEILEIYNVKRMVTGHNVQSMGSIKTECDEKLYGIDVGMSSFYGSNLAAIQIDTNTDNIDIITDPDNPPHPMAMMQPGFNTLNLSNFIAFINANFDGPIDYEDTY